MSMTLSRTWYGSWFLFWRSIVFDPFSRVNSDNSWAEAGETFPDRNAAPVAADAFRNSLRFRPFDTKLIPFRQFMIVKLRIPPTARKSFAIEKKRQGHF
jgi:hypothetical protein